MAYIIKSRNRENGEGTNGTSHFGQTAQVRLTKVQNGTSRWTNCLSQKPQGTNGTIKYIP